VLRAARELALGSPAGPSRRRPETLEPGERSRPASRRLLLSYALAIALPVAASAAMVPVRVDHGRSAAIVLVVPVVAIAALGALGPALVAALSAGAAYDFFLTAPYLHLVIDDPDDVVAAITLAVVGVIVGVMSSRLVRLSGRDTARRSELHHLLRFARATTELRSADELTQRARETLVALLDLRGCEWRPRYHGTDRSPRLLPDGNIMGYETSLNPDRATLPAGIELSAVHADVELGRFILQPRPDHVVSYEERLSAATVAALYAAALSPAPEGPNP
jgi:hypothetical protein